MSKRQTAESSSLPETKRIKKESHAPDCNDKNCQGCDIGQVEISFVRKDKDGNPIESEPSAQELLSMAIDEAANAKQSGNDDDENNDMAHRLFDMAIEKYQKDEPENKLGYATCLVELGKALQVEESISEGLEILRGEKKKQNNEVWWALAGAAIALASAKRKALESYFEQQQQELEDDDGEIDEVAFSELLEKQRVSKVEAKLYKEAIDAAKQASFENIKQVQAVLHEFRAYGQLLGQPFHKQDSDAVLNATIELIQKVPEYETNDELLTVWAACLLHQEKFEEQEAKKLEIMNKAEEMLLKSNELYNQKNKKENPWVWEMVTGYAHISFLINTFDSLLYLELTNQT